MTTTTGILGSLKWTPTTDYKFDTEVGDAIASYCTGAGIECPADELFQCAAWAIPVGTELEAPEWTGYLGGLTAPALRVTVGGMVFGLLIDWAGRCGCGACSGTPDLRVVEVSRV